MFYNFTSASILSSLHQSPRNRPKSTARLNNNTSIAMSPETTYKLDSRSSSQAKITSNKAKTFKLSRRNTAETCNVTPLKSHRGNSGTPTPSNAISPNTSMLSTMSALPKLDITHELKMYDAIKRQQLRYFNRGTSSVGEDISPPKFALTHREETPNLLQGSIITQRPETGDCDGRSSVGLSPRAKLARTAKSFLKPSNVRDTIRIALSSVPRKSGGQNSERNRLFMKREKEKEEKKRQEEKFELWRKQERERKIKEETRVIEKIGQAGSDRFLDNLNLYNKYYAEYLNEPETKFVGNKDLRIEMKPIIEENATHKQMAAFLVRKRTISAQRTSTFSGELKKFDNESRGVTPAKASIIKFLSSKGGRDKANFGFSSEDIEANKEDVTQENNWTLFGKDMRKVETNLSGLKTIGVMIHHNRDLSKEEFQFLRAVKNGNQEDTLKLLKQDSNLVKIKDLRNQTPLHWAIKRGHVQIVGELYDHGADLEAIDIAGRKPMDLVPDLYRKGITNILDQKHWELKRKTMA